MQAGGGAAAAGAGAAAAGGRKLQQFFFLPNEAIAQADALAIGTGNPFFFPGAILPEVSRQLRSAEAAPHVLSLALVVDFFARLVYHSSSKLVHVHVYLGKSMHAFHAATQTMCSIITCRSSLSVLYLPYTHRLIKSTM